MSTAAVRPRAELEIETPPTKVVLVGAGSIGCALLAHITSSRAAAAARLQVCAVIDSSGYVFDPRGLPRRLLIALGEWKRNGRSLGASTQGRLAHGHDALAFIAGTLGERAVLVDATAVDTYAILELVLERGWDVVLANKIPIAGPQWRADRLNALARQMGARIFHEATVGAGLPVVDTLSKLIEAGDRVMAIEGCPSGTLGFMFGRMHGGAAFSTAVREAVAAGYTEPDPRIDLSGLDVARKALILARMLGFRGDLDETQVESLVPSSMREISPAEFLARLPELDAAWRSRVDSARARGMVLRYRARVTRRRVRVGLIEVPATEARPLVPDADNRFEFRTARYRTQPLVISGPGAGSAVAAGGVYNDLLRVARQRSPLLARRSGE